jgi:solute carrier family 31 (copper transporter), member 1
MTPYLHFTGGDYLFFKTWHPSSDGAIVGASIALLILAMSDRLLHAVRGVMDARWRKRYDFMTLILIVLTPTLAQCSCSENDTPRRRYSG